MRFYVHASRRARWGPIAVLLAAVCVFGTAATRSAAHSIIPTLISVTPTGGGDYVWLYNLTLDANSTALGSGSGHVPDFFEQADLINVIPGSETTTPLATYGVGTNLLGTNGWVASFGAPIPLSKPGGGFEDVWTISPLFPAITIINGGSDVVGNGVPGNLGEYAFVSKAGPGQISFGGYGSNDHNTLSKQLQANTGLAPIPVVPVSGAHTAVIGLFGSTLFLLRMRKRA